MNTDGFQCPFGVTILMKTVIFDKFQGWVRGMMIIGQVDLAGPHVVVLVVFKVAVWRQ